MRNPNGYGCVYKLSGKRRKSFAARVTIDWTLKDGQQTATQKYKSLGTFATRAEALSALAAYHDDPHAIPGSITFAQLYDRWSDRKFTKISDSTVKSYKAAYNWCAALYDLPFASLKTDHLQSVIDGCTADWHTKKAIKTLFNQLFSYALENDLVSKNYTQFVDLGGSAPATTRRPFTRKEQKLLWQHLHDLDWIDTVLIMIYTGWRIGELLAMRTDDVDLTEWTMRGGSKTEAGKNRLVPIHSRIRPLIEQLYDPDREYLIPSPDGKRPLSYYTYRDVYFRRVMEQLGMPDHRPHDCRHTFASEADSAGMNKLCIKRIMGHASQDITDRVYTHKTIEELRREIEKIP